ncbi:LytR C-terminal domain-containing protein [Streptomyces beihaiensis]|uniref:LytR C-terminal domain-containing protein n=1 Tax=Streptomyces beihaiensis TaxID=2984495 RepID=A0ABT3U4L6_9ACTN|nr:LytR C-terminal domain-containing protein [Streptomyces beihaiensis]MCX3063175.1 LytR C-terminal domain-containing protein [Streptomyces beihaiensis]
MSMLTPPGMGGKYRITGDKYPRMRRGRSRSRIVLAVVASTAAVGLIGWGSFQLVDVFTGGGSSTTAGHGTTHCATNAQHAASRSESTGAARPADRIPSPAEITVNVFNATPRSGLARKTADELKKRGFKIGDVANATAQYDKKVKGPGILLGAKAASDTALPVLGTQLSGAQRKLDTRKKATEVDLIIGSGFTSLATKSDADKALRALTHPKPTASPSRTCG